MPLTSRLRVVGPAGERTAEVETLNAAFSALADPVRREILMLLDGHALLVSELAANFDITLQAVSRHIQVLVRAGLVRQERTGRINRCSLVTGPIYEAAVWPTVTASTGRISSICSPRPCTNSNRAGGPKRRSAPNKHQPKVKSGGRRLAAEVQIRELRES